MNDDKLSINEVIDEFQSWLEEEFPNDMSPSDYRKALKTLDDLGMMEFEDILETYNNLNCRFAEDFDFDVNDDEFTSKLDEVINDHIAFLEETSDSLGGDDEDDW